MAEETHTIKAVLDTSELQSQLSEARDSIATTLGQAFTDAVPNLGEMLSGGASGGAAVGRSIQNLTGGAVQSLGAATAGVVGGASQMLGGMGYGGSHMDMLAPSPMQQQALLGRIDLDHSLTGARADAQRRYVERAVGRKDSFGTMAGIFGGGVAAAGPMSMGSAMMRGGIAGIALDLTYGALADAQFDEEGWRDHMAAKDTVEASFDFGPVGPLGSPSGLVDARFSNSLAGKINQIADKRHTSGVGDMLAITHRFGSAGYLDQAAFGAGDPGGAAGAVGKQLEMLEQRVSRVRNQLGVDADTASSLLLGGIQSGMSEPEAERLLLRGGAVARAAGMSTGDYMAATSSVASAFYSANMNTGLAREATESAAFSARALQQSSGLTGADWQRLGGAQGVTNMLAQGNAQLLTSERGLPLVAAATTNPRLMKQFLGGEMSYEKLREASGAIYGKMTETEKDSLRARFQKGEIDLPGGMMESAQATEVLQLFKKSRPGAQATQENIENFMTATGMGTPEQAKLMSSMAHSVATDPSSLMGKAAEMERFVDAQEAEAKVETDLVQARAEQRENVWYRKGWKGLVDNFHEQGEFWYGTTAGLGELQANVEKIEMDFKTGKAALQGLGSKQQVAGERALAFRKARAMREHVNQKEEGGGFIDSSQQWLGGVWDQIVTGTYDALGWHEKATQRLLAVGSDDEEQTDAPGQQQGGIDPAMIDQMMQQGGSNQAVVALLDGIYREMVTLNGKSS